jgi:FlaA1/EpsC-like NDP-sugar epimerase
VRKLDNDILRELLGREFECEPSSAVAPLGGSNILITGAGGSIGGHLSELLSAHHDGDLMMVDRHDGALFHLAERITYRSGLSRRMVLADVTDAREIQHVVSAFKPHVVIHCAAYKHVPMLENQHEAAHKNNVVGTFNTIDALAAGLGGRFVLISTDKAVNPVSVMGKTKKRAEQLVLGSMDRNVSTAVVRFGNVAGSSGSVIETWMRQLSEGATITVTGCDMERYFMTIDEAALLVFRACAHQSTGRVHIPSLPPVVKMTDLAARMCRMFGGSYTVGEPRPGERNSELFSTSDESGVVLVHDLHAPMGH